MEHRTRTLNIISIIILILAIFLSAFYFYPIGQEIPQRDYGIYLYLGKELFNGKTIYSEVWEHKPPLIFYINALGLFLTKGTDWGVWLLQIVFSFSTVLLSYLTLKRKTLPIPSLLLTMAAFFMSFQYMSGNLTEEYALLFQAAILFVFLSPRFKNNELINYLIIGVLTGISFNLKQTYIDVTVAIGILLIIEMLLKKRWFNLKSIAFLGVGFFIPNIIVFMVMALNGVIRDWWGAAFIYNFSYSDIKPHERINALFDAFWINSHYLFFLYTFTAWIGSLAYLRYIIFKPLTNFFDSRLGKILLLCSSGFLFLLLIIGQLLGANEPGFGLTEYLVLICFAVCFSLFLIFTFVRRAETNEQKKPGDFSDWEYKKDEKVRDIHDPLLIGIIHFPIVFLLSTLSGRSYTHYFIPLYSSAFLLFSGTYLTVKKYSRNISKQYPSTIIFLLLFFVGLIKPVGKIIRNMPIPYDNNIYRQLIEYLIENSDDDDQILVWGIETSINYLTNRTAPSRFSYVDPVYDGSPFKDEFTAILLEDIISKPPKFILDMRSPRYPFIDSRAKDVCLTEFPADGDDLDKIIHFTCQNYKFVIQLNGMDVYQRID